MFDQTVDCELEIFLGFVRICIRFGPIWRLIPRKELSGPIPCGWLK